MHVFRSPPTSLVREIDQPRHECFCLAGCSESISVVQRTAVTQGGIARVRSPSDARRGRTVREGEGVLGACRNERRCRRGQNVQLKLRRHPVDSRLGNNERDCGRGARRIWAAALMVRAFVRWSRMSRCGQVVHGRPIRHYVAGHRVRCRGMHGMDGTLMQGRRLRHGKGEPRRKKRRKKSERG